MTQYIEPYSLPCLISGGQTGVDTVALQTAMDLGIYTAGWCPLGRRCESGKIPAHFPLRESSSPKYAQRTRLNIRDSDATLIFSGGNLSGGTALTAKIVQRLDKPLLIIDLAKQTTVQAAHSIVKWLYAWKPCILNVAGPRFSEAPHIDHKVQQILTLVLVSAEGSPNRSPQDPVGEGEHAKWPPGSETPDLPID